MRLLGKQFVTGQTIEEALQNGKEREKWATASPSICWAKPPTPKKMPTAITTTTSAIHAIGKDAAGQGVYEGNGISVKLSAIHPRYSRPTRTRDERTLTSSERAVPFG